ncbi:NACHT, LRR and PYD domains-containing protein 4 [Sciurus carolinensis]|uniref:NACHT, LRR and PYD domains-containing protein 4 n=1 Tax=Sciurus carolinensis TaxID=30640 RepID=A0AA41MG63_SCICA|nr:NACHT, LRR and PYD domains-containing protein 4 [Sciurus carolinensis]
MWYLEELRRKEFVKFKELVRQEAWNRGLQPITMLEMRNVKRQGFANLLKERYGEQEAWDLAFSIFPKLNRKDLCEKATRESAIHAYRAHVKEKFSRMWSRESFTEVQGCFDQTITQEEGASFEDYFTARAARKPHTVVLHGVPRIGKTRFLMKLMLAWSDGRLYRDKFSFIFYFCCRELKQLTATSLVGLISRERPDCIPMTEIVAQPERLLFIIDSFEELCCTLSEPESELCSDWREERPVKTVLGSLLRRKILPEAALLLAVMPERPPGLQNKLEHPNMQVLTGFQQSHRKQYFCCLFEDRGQALEAFSLVRDNEQLFTMCRVPLLCWVVGTCLKQELERGRDLAATCCRISSVFLAYVFNLFTPKDASRPSQQGRDQLKALCSLAAEGMWTDTWVFGEEELGRNGIAGTDIPALLDLKVFRKYSESVSAYSFIHMCLQEFCAAMFYLLDSPSGHPSPAVGCTEALLLTFLKKEKSSWVFVGSFLMGLLRESEQQKLDALFGSQRSRAVEPQLRRYLKSLTEQEDFLQQMEFPQLFYSLFEMQSDAFASQVMRGLRGVHLPIRENADLAVSAYCLKYCSNLREICFQVSNVFEEERGLEPTSCHASLWWHQICSVLTTNEHLRLVRVSDTVLSRCALMSLCYELRQPRCPLQTLETSNLCVSGEIRILFEVLTSNPNLKNLTLAYTSLSHKDELVLCSTLTHPVCHLEELLLKNSGFSSEGCRVLSFVLLRNNKLKVLDLSGNELEEGIPALCEALGHPDCTLQHLVLANCLLTEHCVQHFSEALLRNTHLSLLDLSGNALKDEGLAVLCGALRQPTCSLQSLRLRSCSITPRGCPDLASVLTSNPNLRSLELGGNHIGDAGAALLSRALRNPQCCLSNLRWVLAGLGSSRWQKTEGQGGHRRETAAVGYGHPTTAGCKSAHC